MKKTFLGVVALPLLALLATSCANERVETKGDIDNVLTFKAVTGKQTLSRASEIDLSVLQNDPAGLEVYSYTFEGFYRKFDLEYDAGVWTYGTPIFHPMSPLTHYSIYPSAAVSRKPDDGTAPVFEYTVDNDPANQYDLLAATAYSSIQNPDPGVATLQYQHILSQVNFAVLGNKDFTVKIWELHMSNPFNKGTYDFSTGAWTLDEFSRGSYAYTFSDGSSSMITDGGISDDGKIYYLGNEGSGGSNDCDNALMLMPQIFDAAAYFYFRYELRDAVTDDLINQGQNMVRLHDVGGGAWNMGKRYLYILAFDPPLLAFEVDVDPWTDEAIIVTEEDMYPAVW